MQRIERKIYSEFVCKNAMDTALNSPFQFECGPDVEKVRQCCYRVRKQYRARADTRYDGLRFHNNGSKLAIYNLGKKADFATDDFLNGLKELIKKDPRNDA